LAVGSLLMNLLMLFSYFTDGFAYAGEALTGRYIGEGLRDMVTKTVRHVFVWSMGVALVWVFIYLFAGGPLVGLMTDDPSVRLAARPYLWWLVLMPPLGCAAFTWDGIYTGATATAAMRDAMFLAVAAFFSVWFAGRYLLGLDPAAGLVPAVLNLILAAYFAHLLVRTVWLSVRYKRDILR
ncbi:MAG: MATE family efflux transporter, partial [Bacteroidales bacterium]|nr:MATE family efflux transporter [Bacteroidales bacterium]